MTNKDYLDLIDKILGKYQDHILFLFIMGYLMGFLTGVVITLYLLYLIIDKVVVWFNQIRGNYGIRQN